MASLAVSTEQIGTEVHGEIVAAVKGTEVGRLVFADYADYRGGRTCQIRLIEVASDRRREGIATAMAARLRREFPDSRAAQFFLNAAGRALHAAIAADYIEPGAS